MLTEPADAEFQLAARTAEGRRATTRPWDPVLHAALVVGFVLVVVILVNRIEDLRHHLAAPPLAFMLGAFSGLCFVAYALLGGRRPRAAHERFAARGGGVPIVIGSEGRRSTARAWTVAPSWAVVDAVFDLPHGLGIRAGLLTLWADDDALPVGLDRAEHKSRIAAWRGMAA